MLEVSGPPTQGKEEVGQDEIRRSHAGPATEASAQTAEPGYSQADRLPPIMTCPTAIYRVSGRVRLWSLSQNVEHGLICETPSGWHYRIQAEVSVCLDVGCQAIRDFYPDSGASSP